MPKINEEALKAITLLREAEDLLVEAKKVIEVFSDNKSWHKNYDDPTKHVIDTFDHFNLDPRILANKASRSINQIEERLLSIWVILKEVGADE